MSYNFIYITAKNTEEAKNIGRGLVESRLVACVNIIENVSSIYRWEGDVCEDTEAILIAKTTEEHVKDVIEMVKALHSYSCPCIVSLPIQNGNDVFLKWISNQVAID